jgi:CcmD family protein
MKKIIALISFILMFSLNLFAQQSVDQNTVEMADRLRGDGKIYVVVGVVLIVLLGVLFYLVRLDGKISKVEKELKR